MTRHSKELMPNYEDEVVGLKRLPDITISGVWDPPASVNGGVLFQPALERELTIYPRSVTVFGRTLWSERTRVTTRMSFESTTLDGLTTVEGRGIPTGPAVRERAPWWMRLAWYTIGLPIWWLRSWRADVEPA